MEESGIWVAARPYLGRMGAVETLDPISRGLLQACVPILQSFFWQAMVETLDPISRGLLLVNHTQVGDDHQRGLRDG